ncbi:MAG: aminotransferase class V-fold PLP-dependent enzyme [Clostridiales bacterium]|nr:aminotransferase class V-fold PLP-dependent enzyme [Clostridiales bacterium]
MANLDREGLNYRRHGSGGLAERQLPSILNLYFPGCEGQTLLLLLDRKGLAVSLGSACEAGSSEASHVLLAMGYGEEEASSSIRVSLGQSTTAEEMDDAAAIIAEAVKKILVRS